MPPTSKSSGAKRRQSELPLDLIFYVLSYLPVKSLLRFKSVCKSWRDFISDDPNFVALHSERSKKLRKQRALTLPPERFQRGSCSSNVGLIRYDSDGDEEFLLPRRVYINGGSTLKLHPYSVNGVVLIYSQAIDDVYLCNPSTRESISLSHITVARRLSGFYEFGVDLSTNEFKVIRFLRRLGSPKAFYYQYDCEIYASRTGYWKKVDVPLDPNFFWHDRDSSIKSVCMDGVAYWLFTRSEPTKRFFFLEFSLADELWRVMPLPDFGFGGVLSLRKVGGSLCLFNSNYDNDLFDTHDIWVYGDEDTNGNGWTKKQRINLSKRREERRPQQKFAENIGKENLRSLADAGDSDDHAFEQACLKSLYLDKNRSPWFRPTHYTETLVSLRQKIKPINC